MPLIFRKMPIKTIIQSQELLKIKNTISKCLCGYGAIRTIPTCCQECEMVQLLWKIVSFLIKLGIYLYYDPR